MKEKNVFVLSKNDIRLIETALASNQRVEIIQTNSGIKIYTIKRKELNKMT